MSYKFNLDHTLAIGDIHDMITIDIKPQTRCTVTGGDIEIHGFLTFNGTYLTSELEEAPFEGSVPLDITLPYVGGAPDVKPEIVSFDYRVDNKKALTLTLDVALSGYGEKSRVPEVMDAWIDPIVEEPVYEEAVIAPFSETQVPVSEVHVEAAEIAPFPTFDGLAPVATVEEEVCEVPVEEVPPVLSGVNEQLVETLPPMEENVWATVNEEIPYSPLVDLVDPVGGGVPVVDAARIDPIEFVLEEPLVTSEPAVIAPSVEAVALPVADVPAPVVEIVKETVAPEEVPVVGDECLEEPDLILDTFEAPQTPIPEPVHEIAPTPEVRLSTSAAALMDELFAMKRGTAFKEKQVVPARNEPDVIVPESVAVVVDEVVETPVAPEVEPAPVVLVNDGGDSVARQFADGNTVIKMVYVANESQTLGGLLEAHGASLDDVWNLEALADGVTVGDCVMLRYEKSD